ncbi:MFS transporter [Dyella terrae]|nr:MFS transporter [Dyella terrae]
MTSTGQGGSPITRASMVIAALSTVVEWYDFTL